jgi:hypothetical protein
MPSLQSLHTQTTHTVEQHYQEDDSRLNHWLQIDIDAGINQPCLHHFQQDRSDDCTKCATHTSEQTCAADDRRGNHVQLFTPGKGLGQAPALRNQDEAAERRSNSTQNVDRRDNPTGIDARFFRRVRIIADGVHLPPKRGARQD